MNSKEIIPSAETIAKLISDGVVRKGEDGRLYLTDRAIQTMLTPTNRK